MPSTFEPVQVPAELQSEEADLVPRRAISGVVTALLSIFLMIVGMAGMCAGLWWWVHPGAGIAILGLDIYVLAVLIGFTSGRE